MKALPLETAPGQSLIGRRLRALREARRLTCLLYTSDAADE